MNPLISAVTTDSFFVPFYLIRSRRSRYFSFSSGLLQIPFARLPSPNLSYNRSDPVSRPSIKFAVSRNSVISYIDCPWGSTSTSTVPQHYFSQCFVVSNVNNRFSRSVVIIWFTGPVQQTDSYPRRKRN